MSYRIRLSKENFKFSVSHFTIFGPANGERLHGHNYYVGVELLVDQVSTELGLAFDFNAVKPLLLQICKQVDEYVLLPAHSPHLAVVQQAASVQVSFSAKTYIFPLSDVKILPVCNVTSEELARWIGGEFIQLISQLRKEAKISQIAITVEETRGQSVTWTSKESDEF